MSKIGYVRVSTIEQNTDRQEIALAELGITKLFIEKTSGKSADRPQLKKMLEYVREGDVLYIESISRLARSTKDLISIVQILQDKKVELVSLKENIDTSTPQGRFVLTIFGALSELERENMLQRQKEGIAAARIKGKKFGRPLKETPKDWDRVINIWKNGEITAVEAMRRLKLNRGTFYRRVKEIKEPDKNIKQGVEMDNQENKEFLTMDEFISKLEKERPDILEELEKTEIEHESVKEMLFAENKELKKAYDELQSIYEKKEQKISAKIK